MDAMTSTTTIRTTAVGLAAVLAIGTGTIAVAGAADGGADHRTHPAKRADPAKRAAAKAERQKAFAEALGVSVDDVRKVRATGAKAGAERRAERERERAQAQGISVTALREKRAKKVGERLAKAVEAHRLTLAQADAVVAAVRRGEPAKKELRQIRRERRTPVALP
jgi:hypothetical protein